MLKLSPTAVATSVMAIATVSMFCFAAVASSKPSATVKAEARTVACKGVAAVNSAAKAPEAGCNVIAVRTLFDLAALSASDFGDAEDASR